MVKMVRVLTEAYSCRRYAVGYNEGNRGPEAVSYLLYEIDVRRGITVDNSNEISLVGLIENGDLAQLLTALESKPALANSVTVKGEPILAYCIRKKLYNIINILLNNGANPNAEYLGGRKTPLICAIDNKDYTSMKLLLDSGANANAKMPYINLSVLYYATNMQYSDGVDLLLKYGANPKIATSSGETPLHVVRNKKDALKLIKHGAVVDAVDVVGATPLQRITRRGISIDVIHVLLSSGADVNETTGVDTPLTAAIKIGNISAVKLLVEYGANPNLSNESGQSPLACAQVSGNQAIIDYLITIGAK